MTFAEPWLKLSDGGSHYGGGCPQLARCADAIIGVSFFSGTDPPDFGRFDRAFAALFKILGGETWCDELPEVRL